MGFMLPAGVVNTDAVYLFADETLVLATVTKQPIDQTLVVVDYTNLSPPILVNAWAFAVDVSSNPALVVSYAHSDVSGRLAFLLSGGIAGQQYTLTVNINTSGTARTDTLAVNIPSSGDCGCGIVNPVPMLYSEFPLGEPTQGYANTAVRYFWGSAPPSAPNVMDQWYSPDTQTLYEWVTDGTNFFWQTMMSADLVSEAPESNTLYSRYNGYWVPDIIQADAPNTGQRYSRGNGGWVADPIQNDASNDGHLYGRKNNAWVVLPQEPILTDAPIDGNVYGRLNAGWTVVPPPVIGVDAPADGNGYLRTNRGWSSGGRITGSLLIQGNVSIGGTLSVQEPSFFTGNITAYGSIAVANDPISPEQAANKNYVDNAIIGAFNANGYPFLQLAGGTMAGPIELAADPVDLMEPVTLQYFIAHAPGGLTDAPADGTSYGRQNHLWVNVLPLTGGTLTGPLVLSGPPTATSGAATKGYVDSTITAVVPQPSGSPPPMDGNAATGVSSAYARADHVHPSDASKYNASNPSNYQTATQVATALSNYYPTSNPSGYQTAAQVSASLGPYATIASVPVGATATPLMNGNAAVGTGVKWAREDHIHPTDSTRAAVTTLANYLLLTGGTMAGVLTLAGNPAGNLDAATKQYVDNATIDCGTF
jgi:hypothetical protein